MSMKKHEVLFKKIKNILLEQFGEKLQEDEDGTHIAIGDSGVWITIDKRELTFGYGFIHNHFDYEYDDLNIAIDTFVNLLTNRKRITHYFKGNFRYKNKIEFELNSSKYKEFGSASTWALLFWKQTKETVSFDNALITHSAIEDNIEELRAILNK